MDVVLDSTGGAVKGDGATSDTPAISLPLLALIAQARNEHGMRQQDVRRYRHFCSTKVHHLRQILHKTHSSDTSKKQGGGKRGNQGGAASSKKAAKKVKRKAQSAAVQSQNNKGKGNVFTRKTIAVDDVQNDRPLQLLLFEAERAWAHSQELKQASFDKDQDGAIRRHGLARAHRAVQWASALRGLVAALGNDRIDVFSRAELAAYYTLISGYEAFDKGKHQVSLDHFSIARRILDLIAAASDDSRKEALANSFVDSTEPMLRFSAYNLQMEEQDMDALAKQTATPDICQRVVPEFAELSAELKARAQRASNGAKDARLDHVAWRGRTIPIRHPDLVDATSRVQVAETDLRTALQAKSLSESKTPIRSSDHKRQRLTSAQRSAKRRGQVATATSSASAPAAPARAVTSGSRTGMDGYDNLLAALTEAEDVARRLVQDNAEALAKSHSGRYEASGTTLVEAHEYLLFKLLATRIERNAALVQEVQTKSGRRQIRLREALAQLLESSRSKGSQGGARLTAKQKGKEPVQRHAKPAQKKVRPAGKPHKVKARSRAGANGKSQAQPRRAKKSPRVQAREQRLRARADLRSRRISVRTVPGIAKLLDANEMSCSTIGGLGLVESDSDLTTLIEAKSAWFRAELLRFLARSFAFTQEEGKALICLQRASLFVREAQNAMELVSLEQVKSEDEEMPPSMTTKTFDDTERQIAEARLEVQRQLYLKRTQPHKVRKVTSRSASQAPGAAAATRNAQSKAAQAVRDMASKYVEFDAVDLQQAEQLDESLERRFAREAGSAGQSNEVRSAKVLQDTTEPRDVPAGKSEDVPTPVGNEDDARSEEEAFEDTEPDTIDAGDVSAAYDPTNALYEEEERAAAEAGGAAQRRGWLGGWLGRK